MWFPPMVGRLWRARHGAFRQGALALALAAVGATAATLALADRRVQRTTERLHDAAVRLDSLTDGSPLDDTRRAAIAWGYAERLRHGLESPFRLIETAATDTRLTAEERRTVSWALLSRVLRGDSHEVDPAVLDGIGGGERGGAIPGEAHLALISDVVVQAQNPRAAELAVRVAYTLAQTERIVSSTAATLAAEVAALVGDREIARREAIAVVRNAGADPVEEISRRRAGRGFYVERPVLLAPEPAIERDGIELVPALLQSLRDLDPEAPSVAEHAMTRLAQADTASEAEERFARELRRSGAQLPPASALAVTVQRYLPTVRAHARTVDTLALRRAVNGESLVGALPAPGLPRGARRAVGRLLVAAAVSARSLAQDASVFAADTALTGADVAITTGLSSVEFDRDVPRAWRPHLLASLVSGVRDLRRVLPTFDLTGVNVRFRMVAPADSALAMHDPRTRTLHLPAVTAGGTLLHELAHELDRQSAVQAGLPGYRSDAEARASTDTRRAGRGGPGGQRVAASLRALAEESADFPRVRKSPERPAEIFATRVDWFTAQALARQGIASGFLSGVQDEMLTGHVVHPERLRTAFRSRSLLDALEGMTTVALQARSDPSPGVHAMLQWSLAAPVDRAIAARIVARGGAPWEPSLAAGAPRCDAPDRDESRARLVGLAAEARARGWLRQRARWMAAGERPAWARALLGQSPWRADAASERITELRDHVLAQLASGTELAGGLAAYAAPLASLARCE